MPNTKEDSGEGSKTVTETAKAAGSDASKGGASNGDGKAGIHAGNSPEKNEEIARNSPTKPVVPGESTAPDRGGAPDALRRGRAAPVQAVDRDSLADEERSRSDNPNAPQDFDLAGFSKEAKQKDKDEEQAEKDRQAAQEASEKAASK